VNRNRFFQPFSHRRDPEIHFEINTIHKDIQSHGLFPAPIDSWSVFTVGTALYSFGLNTTHIFDLGTLELNADLTFRIFFTLSCDAALSMEHCLSGDVTSDNVCTDERTLAIECQPNIGSFDPNDKRAFNAHGRESDQVDKDEYITYHIRFQNTGTDTAFTVRIIDPRSSYLDLSTIEMLSASHPYTYEFTDGHCW